MGKKIAIIGGGIAGSSVALYLSKYNLDISLFELKNSLVSGPPMCHLHSGGNLYREISDEQCLRLLKESIDLVKLYPLSIDYRPTIIALPTYDNSEPKDLLRRLDILKNSYENLIKEDISNKVLGESKDYYKLYDKKTLQELKNKDNIDKAKSLDDFMISVAKNLDFDKVKFPLIMVQEYGLNIFRLASSTTLELEKNSNVKLFFNTKVTNINHNQNSFTLEYKQNNHTKSENFDYIINAAGFRSGEIDDMLNIKRDRFVEFKAAYITKINDNKTLWPELVFFGQRGTPKGMGQFTPYPGGYVQLHAMSKDITLFEDGLVKNTKESSQPPLNKKYIDKIDKTWSFSKSKNRSIKAINFLSRFIPDFKEAKVASIPLYGAQQIPGDDADLRAAEVSFEDINYARCEIVKASSVISMAKEISYKLHHLGFINKPLKENFTLNLNEKDVLKLAKDISDQRGYPKCLAYRSISKPIS